MISVLFSKIALGPRVPRIALGPRVPRIALDPRNLGTLEPWYLGPLEPLNIVTLKRWNPGILEPWNLGTLDDHRSWRPNVFYLKTKKRPNTEPKGAPGALETFIR